MKKKKKPLVDFVESLSEAMFKYTRIVMYFAPIGVGAAMAYTVGHMGVNIFEASVYVIAYALCCTDWVYWFGIASAGFVSQNPN